MRTSGPLAAPATRSPASRMSWPVAAIAVVVLALPLAGCAGDPTPRAWAASVCQALGPWRTEIATLSARTQRQMAGATTPAQAKENLVRLFGGAQKASESARAGVQQAGAPDVDNGTFIWHSFTASLGAMRDAYGRAGAGIEALPTDPAEAFYTNVAAVVDTLNKDYAASELDTSRLNSPALKKAFDEVPECR